MATFSQPPQPNGNPDEIPQEQVETSSSGFLDVDDLVLSPFRAAEGLLRGTIGMIDMIPGIDTGIGEAPRFTGTPDTAAGSFLTGSLQFLMGFVPVFGSLGTASNVARASRIAAIQGRQLSVSGQAAATVGRFLAGTPTTRAMTAGAFVDFAGYDGNEARLSDMIEGFPALKNPITSFLASDENDSEAAGRFKNAVEGLGLGVFTDLLIPSLRGIHKQRKAKLLGFTDEDAAAQGMEESSRYLNEIIGKAEAELDFEGGVQSGRSIDLGDGDILDLGSDKPIKEGRRKRLAAVLGLDKEFVDQVINDKLPIVKKVEGDEQVFSVTDSDFEMYPEHNPKNLTADQKLMAQIGENPSWNGTKTVLDMGSAHLIRALELLQKGDPKQYKLTRARLERLAMVSLEKFATMAGEKPELVVGAWSAQAKRSTTGVMGAIVHANAGRMLMRKISGELFENAKLLQKDGNNPALDAAFVSNVAALEKLRDGTMGLTRVFGQALRSLGHSIGADAAENVTELSSLILNGGTRKQQLQLADAITMAYDRGTEADIAGLQRFMKLSPLQKGSRRFIHYFLNSILSGPKTIVINVASPLLYKGYSMSAEALGGIAQVAGSRGQNSQVLQGLWSELTGVWQGMGDSVKAAQVSWRTQTSQFARDADTAFGDAAARRQFGVSPFDPKSFGAQEGTMSHRLLAFVNSGINFPLRAARSGDELTKQIIGRGHARKQLTMEALSQGLTPEESESFIKNGMEKLFFEGELFNEDQIRRRGMKGAVDAGVTHRGAVFDAGDRALAEEQQGTDFDVFTKMSERVRSHTVRQTFTGELPDGSVTRKLQSVITAHPMLKIFLPFVQTPTNLIKEGLDNFAPLTATNIATNYLGANTLNFWRNNGMKHMADSSNQILKQLASADANERWEAGGRLAMSTGFSMWAINMAMEGRITGNGPSDPELRNQMTQSGWLPYSIRTNSEDGQDRFIQFGRLDPLAVTMGIIGDYAEALKHSDVNDQESMERHASALFSSVAGLLSQKSYFTGVKNLVETFTDPEGNTPKAVGMLFSSVVPNFGAQIGGAMDPVLRELEGATDSLRYRLPTLHTLGVEGRRTLPPARNILGEQVRRSKSIGEDALGAWVNALQPIVYRDVNDSVVAKEMTMLQHGFTPPKQKMQGLDLRDFVNPNGGQDSYDRWQQLTGTTTIGGKTLKQALKKLFKSTQYQRMDPTSNMEYISPRVTEIRKVLSRYRTRAFRQIGREYPDLKDQLRENTRLADNARRAGGFEAVSKLQSGLPTFQNPFQGE